MFRVQHFTRRTNLLKFYALHLTVRKTQMYYIPYVYIYIYFLYRLLFLSRGSPPYITVLLFYLKIRPF